MRVLVPIIFLTENIIIDGALACNMVAPTGGGGLDLGVGLDKLAALGH